MLSEAGIKFDRLPTKGIDPQLFSEYFMASGIYFFFSRIQTFVQISILFLFFPIKDNAISLYYFQIKNNKSKKRKKMGNNLFEFLSIFFFF